MLAARLGRRGRHWTSREGRDSPNVRMGMARLPPMHPMRTGIRQCQWDVTRGQPRAASEALSERGAAAVNDNSELETLPQHRA